MCGEGVGTCLGHVWDMGGMLRGVEMVLGKVFRYEHTIRNIYEAQ